MRPSAPLGVAALLATLSLLLVVGQGASAETYEQAVEGTASLAHLWPMGEGSGSSFADAIGGADAEVAGGVTLGEPGGLVGDAATAALFGGSGSAQAGVDLSGSGKLTVEFWMKWSAFAEDDALAMEFTPNFNEHAGGFLIDPDASDGGGKFGVGVGEGASRNNVYFTRPSAEAWHYYAFVIDTEGSGATEIKPYVDGHEVSYTKSESGTGGGFAESTLYWMSRDASSLFGSGSMQDLALYEGTLSSTTVLEHYEIGEGGPKASFTSAPVVASAGVPVRLDGSGSSSPSGSIVDHAWDFNGSETYSTDTGGSATTSHTFSSPGTYTVDLRVEDGLGETATVSKTITVGAAPGRYEQAVEGLSSVAHLWPMGEASGASFADVFAGADASVVGGVTLGEPGALVGDTSTSALFDGSSGAAHAGVDLSGSGELTVEFWMKWSAYADDDALAMEFTPNFNEHAGGFLIDPNASTGEFGVGVGEGASRNNVFFARPSAEAWHYYAFVIDTTGSGASEIKPYVDGHEVSYTKSESGTGGGFADSTLYWMSRDASSLFGSGSMQNLALYDGTLSSTAVLEHYEIGEGGPKASFTSAPVQASVGVPVRLDASGSSSPAGSIGDYAWDFNGGKGYGTDAGSSATTSHTFSAPGTYTVDLRVKDGLGETSTVSHTITVGAALGAYEQSVEDTPAVSHFWPMGESSGSSFADVFSGADASVAGGVTLGEPGGLVEDPSTAALFNGSSGAASAPVDLSGSGKLTVEFWMKWKAFAEDDALAMEFTPNFNEHSGGFLVDPNASGGGTFGVGVGQGSSRNNVYFTRPSAEAWHHYAFVIDTTGSGATEIKPYVDGHEVSYSKTESGTGGGFANSTLYWMSRDASSLFGSGAMQDLALYDDALDATTIAEHYAWGENTYRPANTTAPSIEGTAQDGQALTANPGAWSGFEPIHYAYQWQSCNLGGEECQDIEGATDQTYTPTSGDLETTLRVVVTASNAGSSAHASSPASTELESGAPSELEAPSISGDPRAGETLFADAGVWGGTETEVGYQWERCNATGGECTSIVGATEPEYTLGEGGIGTTLRVRVGVSNALGSLTAVSSATEAIGDVSSLTNTWAPSISGTPQSGHTLTANAGSWLGLATIGYAYQWQSCDGHGSGCEDIEGATASTYVLETGDVGNTLRVRVSAIEVGGTVGQTTAATQPIAAANAPVSEEPPTVQGTSLQGYTLTASTGAWSGGEGPLTYGYQWQRCDEHGGSCSSIDGATAGTHTLAEGDVGSTLRVLVTATDGASHATTAASAPTALISPTTLVDITTPSISGTHQLGRALSADPGIWTAAGAIAYAYEWERCDEHGESCSAITGATEPSYTPGEADVGDTVKVMVTASGTAGTDSATSAATPAILSEPIAPESQSPPSIEGNLTAGETLTAQPGSWLSSETISYGYQWQRCNEEGEECADIEGATSSTYTLGEGDIGSTLQVVVTASNSLGSVSATSDQSEVVGAAGPPSNEKAPRIQGTPQQGQPLFAGNGDWSGSRPLTYFYRWERCDSSGEACAAIEGATSSSYAPTSGDVGSTVRLKVAASNSLGSAGALSAATAVVAASGEASVSQALEVAEETDPSVLAPSTAATLEEQTVKPETSDTGEALSSENALTSSSVSKETAGEFAVNTPDGELSLAPVDTAPNASQLPTIVNGTAAVFAGTSPHTDTIVRPDALGATTLLQLRSSAAPTSFSWEVRLGADQQLQQLSNGSVAVVEPTSGSYLEGTLSSEGIEEPGAEGAAETEGESGVGGEASEEALGSSLEEASPLEKLAAAPTTTTPEITPKTGELHPQETEARYGNATSAMTYAEGHVSGTVLIVVEQPEVMDAEGHSVPASLSVDGNRMTMTISPETGITFPVTASFAVAASSDKASASKTPKKASFGLSDEQKSAFDESKEGGNVVDHFDYRLKNGRLAVKTARLIVNYNTSPHSEMLHEWVEAVEKEGLKPYITFRSCVPQQPNYGAGKDERPRCPSAPSPTSASFPGYYYNHVLALMKELIKDEVRTFGAWNEPNKYNDPLHLHPKRAAVLWGEAQHAAEHLGCRLHCIVVAGEFTAYQKGYIGPYVGTILHDAKIGIPTKTKATFWGFHDYNDVKNVREETRAGKEVIAKSYRNVEAQSLVHYIKTKRLGSTHIWLSEQGIQVETNTNKSGKTRLTGNGTLQRLAAQDFLRLGTPSEHIDRVYYYGYRGPSKHRLEELASEEKHEFDSALLYGEGFGTEPADWRPAYCVLALGLEGCPAKTTTKAPVAGTTKSTVSTVLLSVNPMESSTHYWIEYGTTTEYGHTTTLTALANAHGEQSETVSLSGLEPCTTYHYQALAENEANEGTPSLGGDRTFKTRCEVGIFLAKDGVGTPTELWEVKADGSGAHSLGAPPEGGEPSLSPDGSSIAYASNKYPYPSELRTRGVGGGSSTTVYTYSSGGPSIDWPRWSPDGSKLIFSVTIYGAESHTLIDSINADGTGFKTLVTIPGPHLIFSFPSYSPDGSKITFFAPAAGGGVQIDVANADGSDVSAVTNTATIEPEEQPRFSPDGTKIAFSAVLPGSEYNQRIYTINTDGSDLTEVTHGFTEASEEWAFEPEWTPDGSKIVYAYELGKTGKTLQKYELYVANADGSGEATPFLPSLSGVTESWGMSFAP